MLLTLNLSGVFPSFPIRYVRRADTRDHTSLDTELRNVERVELHGIGPQH